MQAQVAHQRHEDEQSAQARAKGARRDFERANIGNGGGFGANDFGPLVIAPPGQPREAFLVQEDGQRMNAHRVAFGGEFALNVIDRQVLFAQGDGAFAHHVTKRRMLGSWTRCREEA